MTEATIPVKFASGTTVGYRRQISSHRADDGWSLNIWLVGPSRLTKAGVAAGADFDVALTVTDTQALLPGVYTYAERVSKLGEVVDITQCVIEVTADISALAPGENLTADERLLGAIDKVIAGRIDADVEQYSIKDRSLTKIPFAELIKYRGKLSQKVAIARRGLGAYMGGGMAVTFTGLGAER